MIKILFILLLSIYSYADIYALHAMSTNGRNLYHTTSNSVSADQFKNPGYFFYGQNLDTLDNSFAFSDIPTLSPNGTSFNYGYNLTMSVDRSLPLDKNFYLRDTKDSLIMFFSSIVGTTSITVRPLGFCLNATGLASKPYMYYDFIHNIFIDSTYLINFTSSKIETDYSAQCVLYTSYYSQSKASSFLKTDFDANNTYFYLYRKMFSSADDLTKYNKFVSACSSGSLSCSIKNPFNLNGCKTEITNMFPDNFSIKNKFAKFIPLSETCNQFLPGTISYRDKRYSLNDLNTKEGTSNCKACIFDFDSYYLTAINLCDATKIKAERDCRALKGELGVVVDFTCTEDNGLLNSNYKCNDAFVLSDIVKNPDGSFTIGGIPGGYKDPATGKIYTADGRYTGFVSLPDGRIVREGSPDSIVADVDKQLDAGIDEAIEEFETDNPIAAEVLSAFKVMYTYAKDKWGSEQVLMLLDNYEQNDYDFRFSVMIFGVEYDLFSKNRLDMLLGKYIPFFREMLIYLAYLTSVLAFIKFR